jgi:DUF4097 and DUF4098 domain-containing protein YvlB
MKLKLYSLVLPLLALALALALPAFAATPIDKAVTVKPDGNVHISNVAGSVKITTWKQNEVHVGGTLGAGVKRLAVEKTAGGVAIRVIYPRHGNSEGSRLTIQLPATSRLKVNTTSADISASGLSGASRIGLQTVSGDINLQSKSGHIAVQSVSGDIRINGSATKARVAAQSISGEVKVANVGGRLALESVSGGIHVDAANPIAHASLDTTSGDIQFSAAIMPNGNYDFHSTSGDVTLNLPKVPAATFDATSLSGDIDTNFGPKPHRTSEYGPGKEWHYRKGSGKAQVNINTTSGDIRIHAKQPPKQPPKQH